MDKNISVDLLKKVILYRVQEIFDLSFIKSDFMSHYKELFITGFTFRLDGYYPEYKTKEQDTESYIRTCIKRPIHNLNNEKVYKFMLDN